MFHQGGLVKFLVIILIFGDELDDDGPNVVNHATVTANANIPYWTTNLTDQATEPITQECGPSLTEKL